MSVLILYIDENTLGSDTEWQNYCDSPGMHELKGSIGYKEIQEQDRSVASDRKASSGHNMA